MKIISLHLYPIKGLAGISVQEAQTANEGFVNDRRWMLVNNEGTFLSQRSHPTLALFQQKLFPEFLQVSFRNASLKIDLTEMTDAPFEVTLFDQTMLAREVSKEVSDWFSEQLGEVVKLVRHSDATQRFKKLIKGPEKTAVGFADGYPYLILGTASLKKLNQQLEEALPMNRFRPNIVIETEEAHIEDSWNKIKIGQQSFMVIKPCARCEVTTIDQTTGIRGKEPLKTLATYRRDGNMVNFGANAISLSEGVVSLRDVIEIID